MYQEVWVNFLIYNIMTGEIFLLQWILNLLPYMRSFLKSLKLILKFLKLTVRTDQYIRLDEDDLKVFWSRLGRWEIVTLKASSRRHTEVFVFVIILWTMNRQATIFLPAESSVLLFLIEFCVYEYGNASTCPLLLEKKQKCWVVFQWL